MKEKVFNKGRKKKRPLYECPNQRVNNNSLCMTGYKTDSTHKSILKNSLGMRLHTHTCTTFFPPHWRHHTSIPPHDHHILHSHHSSSIPFYLWVDPQWTKWGSHCMECVWYRLARRGYNSEWGEDWQVTDALWGKMEFEEEEEEEEEQRR